VTALLDEAARLENQKPADPGYGREPVCDDDRRPADHRPVGGERPRDRDAPALAARELDAALTDEGGVGAPILGEVRVLVGRPRRRAVPAARVRGRSRGPHGRLHLHRGLVQPEPAPFALGYKSPIECEKIAADTLNDAIP